MTEHDMTPPYPKDGDVFICTHCGYTATYVQLYAGTLGEWV